jgi:uncharacterized Ntn-hydrolase superfamily protein
MRDFLKMFLFYLLFIAPRLSAQDTFSILAYDSITREVGAAGASCVDLFNAPGYSNHFIAELFPDTGAIATQASYLPSNQSSARARMRTGDSAKQIIKWLEANDASGTLFNNKNHRQYGVVKFGEGSAAYTGSSCLSYANHINGTNYSIQGNILLGKEVLDSMEARFLRAEGDLACKLMAAMQGANMVGADSRCAGNNSSSLFAFLKVTQPADTFGKPSFLISLKTHNGDSIEPIDSLQVLFDAARTCTTNTTGLYRTGADAAVHIFPNPASTVLLISAPDAHLFQCLISDLSGRIIFSQEIKGKATIRVETWPRGFYVAELRSGSVIKQVKLVLE